jgi:hypothetical protein
VEEEEVTDWVDMRKDLHDDVQVVVRLDVIHPNIA